MKLRQYNSEARRTLPKLPEGIKMDLCHMVLGMATEVLELEDAIRANDKVNVGEELADIMWYWSNYLFLRNLPIPETLQVDVNSPDRNNDHLLRSVLKLQDVVKGHIAYNKVIDEDMEYELLLNILSEVSFVASVWGLPLMVQLELNIKKLKQRYPDKFDNEKALNRDLEAERKILENDES